MAEILQRLSQTIESLAELRVVTAVGDVTINVKVDHQSNDVTALPAENLPGIPGIFSEVNLFTGDIKTLIHQDYKDENNPIAKMHAEQIKNGQKIVADNVNTITRLAQSASDEIKSLLKQPSRKPS